MTYEEQLKLWLEGTSVHNEEDDICCPDFSCCNPNLLADELERKAFTEAHHRKDYAATDAMCMMFLQAAIQQLTEDKVYFAGETDIEKA